MEVSLIVLFWVIITIAQTINDRKKAPPPPEDLDFEIPPLKKPDEVEEIDIENFGEISIETDEEIDLEEIHKRKNNSVATKINSEVEEIEEKNFELDLTSAAVMNAIIMSEILDKPKALRRKKF